MEDIKIYINYVARGIEAVGVMTLLVGTAISLIRYFLTRQGLKPRSYKILRQELGKTILLGLEILVAGDIIGTVVTEPTMDRVCFRSNSSNKDIPEPFNTSRDRRKIPVAERSK